MALTKNDIADSIYNNMDFPRKDCLKIVHSFFDIMRDELIKGNDVTNLKSFNQEPSRISWSGKG